jgi:formate hydrogenlyase subunit 6/NADH:ubiquinone oxidoreductase subunit I
LCHDAEICLGCGICAYVCSPRAICLESRDEGFILWKFLAGRCSFCGYCAQHCPAKAIRLESKEPIVAEEQSQNPVEHKVIPKTCPRCGRPIRPLSEKMLKKIYPGDLPEAALEGLYLCEECRRKATVGRIRDAYIGKGTGPKYKPADK